MDLIRKLDFVKGCYSKRELGLVGLMILWIVKDGECLLFESAVVVAEV